MKTVTNILYAVFVFACFTLSPRAQAVSPAPDGGYPGGNTAEGQNALFSLTSGGFNTQLVSFRSGATPLASSIPLLARGRSLRVPQMKIRPLAPRRF